ncbi:MAG TPA: helix-turn-helix domain-containing protein [Candidatus Limnocylindrales bacterium]|nr:helix-turn-helix domain-containing protein [Candidatus Limnocylindrales bacterium]
MNDQQVGGLFRAVRVRRGWRQIEVANRASVSQSTVSRVERGLAGTLPLDVIRRIGATLEIRAELGLRWRGADLDRLRSARHSALHESVARAFARSPGWILAPEVSFSIFGERGIVDLLAWNRRRGALLVIELKTEIVDVNELVGTFDRKIRLGRDIAVDHGWAVGPATPVSGWVILVDSATNRRRLHEHVGMLRSAYPMDGRSIGGWLAKPTGSIRCLGFWRLADATGRGLTGVKRVADPARARATRDEPARSAAAV